MSFKVEIYDGKWKPFPQRFLTLEEAEGYALSIAVTHEFRIVSTPDPIRYSDPSGDDAKDGED